MEIKIVLTDAEAKALGYVAYSPEEWAIHAVKDRARQAMDEIFQLEVERILADPNATEIPASKEQVVLDANIQSAKERTDIIIAQDSNIS